MLIATKVIKLKNNVDKYLGCILLTTTIEKKM